MKVLILGQTLQEGYNHTLHVSPPRKITLIVFWDIFWERLLEIYFSLAYLLKWQWFIGLGQQEGFGRFLRETKLANDSKRETRNMNKDSSLWPSNNNTLVWMLYNGAMELTLKRKNIKVGLHLFEIAIRPCRILNFDTFRSIKKTDSFTWSLILMKSTILLQSILLYCRVLYLTLCKK